MNEVDHGLRGFLTEIHVLACPFSRRSRCLIQGQSSDQRREGETVIHTNQQRTYCQKIVQPSDGEDSRKCKGNKPKRQRMAEHHNRLNQSIDTPHILRNDQLRQPAANGYVHRCNAEAFYEDKRKIDPRRYPLSPRATMSRLDSSSPVISTRVRVNRRIRGEAATLPARNPVPRHRVMSEA